MQELITTDAHSDIMGGSTAERRIMCPGSLKAESGKPRDQGSSYANEGTALHQASEWILSQTDELLPNNKTMEAVIDKKFNGIKITGDLYYEKILPAMRAFMEIIQEYDIVDYLVEVKAGMPEIPGAFGTVDILAVTSKGDIVVIDWKFGDGIYVDVDGNFQLFFYTACALLTNDPFIVDFLSELRQDFKVYFGVIQPRRGRDEDIWRIYETNEGAVFEFVESAQKAIEIAQGPNPPLRTGKHCWKCRAELVCPERQRNLAEVQAQPDIKLMTPLEMSAGLKLADKIEGWIKQMRKHAHEEMERGVKVPDYKLVAKRGTRKWADETRAEKVLRRKLTVKGAYKKQLISPAQAEKAVGKKDYTKLLDKYATVESSGTTVADATDKRQEVTSANMLEKGIQEVQQQAISNSVKSIFDK